MSSTTHSQLGISPEKLLWLWDMDRIDAMADNMKMGATFKVTIDGEDGMDSFERLNDDVINDDNITSAKCMGYLSRMRSLCEDMWVEDEMPEYVTVSNCIDLPRDFFGEVLNVGDKVRKWPTSDQVEFYKEQVYYIQALELWEDGWHVNITDNNGCEYGSVGPTDVVKDCQPSVKNILMSFVLEFCGELRGGDDEILDKYADMLRVKENE